MSQFTLEMLADQCGVSMPNLRAWQRYGLIQPFRGPDGQRFYAWSHLIRVEQIVAWINQGVELPDIARLLKGDPASLSSQWVLHQQALLAALEKQRFEKARTLLRRLGRELPASGLIDNIIAPLRSLLSHARHPSHLTLRAVLDTLIVEYTSFVLQSLRKRPAATLTLIPVSMSEPLEIWLAALRYAGEGMRIELVSFAVPRPALNLIESDHIMLWSDVPPGLELTQQLALCKQQGQHIFTTGPGFSSQPLPEISPLALNR